MPNPMSMVGPRRGALRIVPAASVVTNPAPPPSSVVTPSALSPDATDTASSVYSPTSAPTPVDASRRSAIVGAIGQADYDWLVTVFGEPWLLGLSPDEAVAEVAWHRNESAGFPVDSPSDGQYSEHYALRHPGMGTPPREKMVGSVPSPSPSGAHMGRLDPQEVIDLGLVPLGSAVQGVDPALIEPSQVYEGMIILARDGSRHRVVLQGDRFRTVLVEAVSSSPPTSQAPIKKAAVSGKAIALGIFGTVALGAIIYVGVKMYAASAAKPTKVAPKAIAAKRGS